MTTSSIILKRCDADYSDRRMFQVDDGCAMKNYAELSEEDRKAYLHRLQSLFLDGNRLMDARRLLGARAAEVHRD
jgi:hypothetical protein